MRLNDCAHCRVRFFIEPHLEMNVSAMNTQVSSVTYHFESPHNSINMLRFVFSALLGRCTWYVDHLQLREPSPSIADDLPGGG